MTIDAAEVLRWATDAVHMAEDGADGRAIALFYLGKINTYMNEFAEMNARHLDMEEASVN